VLLTKFSGTGNSAGSTHDFQVADDGGTPLFVACDEKCIRAYDLNKSQCIKKGVSGWVQQLFPAGGGQFVCTGASICGDESVWTVSRTEVKKVTVLKSPHGHSIKGMRLCQNPGTGQAYGVAGTKLLELELNLARGTSAWRVVKVVGELEAEAAGGRATPFVSEEGRLYTHSRAGLQEWVA
jgi:hypothetical protein